MWRQACRCDRKRHVPLASVSRIVVPSMDEKPLGPRIITRFLALRVCAAVMAVIGIFTVAFKVLEGWSILDSFYFSTTTIATIGFGDLRPSGLIGRLLTLALAVSGIGLLGGLVSGVLGEWLRPYESPREDAPPTVPPWAEVTLLLGIGVTGIKLCQPACRWFEALYLVLGAVTTAGLGDVVPTTAAAKLFIGVYSPLAVITFARLLGNLALRPLDAARSAAQRKVLDQFGKKLTPETLAGSRARWTRGSWSLHPCHVGSARRALMSRGWALAGHG